MFIWALVPHLSMTIIRLGTKHLKTWLAHYFLICKMEIVCILQGCGGANDIGNCQTDYLNSGNRW